MVAGQKPNLKRGHIEAHNGKVLATILFPEMRAIARAHAGTHANKFTCAIYRTREIIVFSRKEKFFIEGFSIEHN